MKHDEMHERLLASVVTGEAKKDDPDVQRMLAECSVCREHRDDLDSIAKRLDRDARHESDMIRKIEVSAAGADTEASMEELARFARAHMESDAPSSASGNADSPDDEQAPARGVRRNWRPWLAAAAMFAAVVWIAVMWSNRDRSQGDRDVPLGARLPVAVQPVGDVDAFERFEWGGEIAADASCIVEVRDGRPGADGEIVARSEERFEAWWEPDDTAGWPDIIRWRIVVYDARKLPIARSRETTATRGSTP